VRFFNYKFVIRQYCATQLAGTKDKVGVGGCIFFGEIIGAYYAKSFLVAQFHCVHRLMKVYFAYSLDGFY
jgi:hypothetical protein